MGVFRALGEIKEYEEEHFGEVFTSLDDPEKVASVLYYIIGEDAINELVNGELNEFWDNEVNEEILNLLITKIDSLLAEMD